MQAHHRIASVDPFWRIGVLVDFLFLIGVSLRVPCEFVSDVPTIVNLCAALPHPLLLATPHTTLLAGRLWFTSAARQPLPPCCHPFFSVHVIPSSV